MEVAEKYESHRVHYTLSIRPVVLKIPEQMGYYVCISKFLLITPETWIIWVFKLFKYLSPSLVLLIRNISYFTIPVLHHSCGEFPT
jgi:hypothetical protein